MSEFLVTGATGKTGSRLVKQLESRGHTVRAASRSGAGRNGFRFDWSDPASYASAVDGIQGAYLLAPLGVTDLLPAMQPFIDRLIEARAGRLVLLSSSSLDRGGPLMGAIHAYLADHSTAWTVLRPSWFMQNFSEGPHAATVREERTLYSATGVGRVGFISADDIAEVAATALTSSDPTNRDLVITGPETLSYGDVAEIIGGSIGERVVHRNLSVEALAARHEKQGIPPDFARMLAGMDGSIASGTEDRVTSQVQRVTGARPTNFTAFAAQARDIWR